MLDDLRKRVAHWINPPKVVDRRVPAPRAAAAYEQRYARAYAAAQQSRLTADWAAPNTSADSQLSTDLVKIRSRSRQLVRDNSFAKRAKVILQNNVIGTGIGMDARVRDRFGKLAEDVNDEIEEQFERWAYNPLWCHTGGALCLADMERLLIGQVFEAGEILIRQRLTSFGGSPVPLCLEVIEPERLADEWQQPIAGLMGYIRMGVKRDEFGRPQSFFIRRYHPGEVRFIYALPDSFEEVSADQIWHLMMRDRWPQTRGEPWLHAAARKLNDMGGYSDAELVNARAGSMVMGVVESAEDPVADDEGPNGEQLTDLEPGTVQYVNPGEKFTLASAAHPNPNVESFMRFMLREVAAGVQVSYSSLSRDSSQSNFSSSRMDQLEDRDMFRVLQQWFVRSFRRPLHSLWLQQAVLSGYVKSISVSAYAADPYKYEAALFKTRGWSYVDPAKDVRAYREAIAGGLTTRTDVIAEFGNGKDIEDVDETRREELDSAAKLELVHDTDPAVVLLAGEMEATSPDAADPPGATQAKVLDLRSKTK